MARILARCGTPLRAVQCSDETHPSLSTPDGGPPGGGAVGAPAEPN